MVDHSKDGLGETAVGGSPEAPEKRSASQPIHGTLSMLESLREEAKQGGGSAQIERQHARGKLTAR